MKKLYANGQGSGHLVLGSKYCIECGGRLKKRFEQVKKHIRCYRCHVKHECSRRHFMR